MKNNSIGALIAKIVVALLAVAGAVYVIVAFGDKIVAWFKKVTASLPCCCKSGCEDCEECDCEDCQCEEEACEAEEAAEEAAPADDAVVAEENEFEN